MTEETTNVTNVTTPITAGCRVRVVPRGHVIFSLREILSEHGKITGVVESVADDGPFPDAPYVVKLDHRDDRRRWCRRVELTREAP